MPLPQLITVVMPVFNERDTLRAAVERFRKTQLPLPAELVVVDDGSTDGSLDTVADLGRAGAGSADSPGRRNRGKRAAVRAL
jgi:glycosyltransferase involved in cell wall biosynthesis